MIDERILHGLKRSLEEMKKQGQVPSKSQLDKEYLTFRQRFSPDALQQLEGDALLNAMHAHGNRDSLVYWLEFKDDDDFHGGTFGGIGGGAANKFGIWRRKEDGQWMAADGMREISTEEAVAVANRNRDQFARGCDALQRMPQGGDEDAYRALQKEMDRVAPDVSNSAWGHKYFHMMFPEKIEDYHSLQFQRFYLVKLLQSPPENDGRYLVGGRYVALAMALDLPMTLATRVLSVHYGRPHGYWRVGTSDGTASRNRWGLMRDGSCVAVGWPAVGDLSELEPTREGREKLRSMMQQHYPSTPQAVGRAMQQLFNFRRAISEGDLIVAMDGATVLAIGRAVGLYQFDASSDFCHRIPVEWLSMNEWKLPQPEGRQTTCREIKLTQNRIEIERRLLGAAPVVVVKSVQTPPTQGRMGAVRMPHWAAICMHRYSFSGNCGNAAV